MLWLLDFCPRIRDWTAKVKHNANFKKQNGALLKISPLSLPKSMIPHWENIIETKKCRLSGQEFFVTDKDLEFYDKISPIFSGQKYQISSPTLCPNERMRRRFSWRNERNFYHRKCDFSGKQFISMYDSSSPYTIYEPKVWYSDDWDRWKYGRKIDFDTSFFSQFHDFSLTVPRIGIDLVNCENSDFCNYCWDNKDCYLDIAWEGNYRSFYNLFTKHSQFAVDTTFVYNSVSMYECMFCYQSSMLQYCMYTENCDNCFYSFNLKGCSECILCSNLRWKKYHIYNKSYSEEEYTKIKNKVLQERGRIMTEYSGIIHWAIHRDYYRLNCENCSGDNLANSKNCFYCYNTNDSEESKYLYDVLEAKHCMDMNYSLYQPEWSYELISTLNLKNSAWNMASHYCRDVYYSDQCNNSNNIFACIWLNHATNCIMNKPYSLQEYEKLCGHIIDHMRSSGEWGEFFPSEISPFWYNETVAQEYFPMTPESVSEKWWNWKIEEETSSYHGTYYNPLPLSQYDERIVGYETAQKNIDAVLGGIIKCEISWKPFKIIRQELAFYIENNILLPKKHPNQRHKERMTMRNPRTLYERKCSECNTNILTTYSPDRTEKVVCESCYKKLIY